MATEAIGGFRSQLYVSNDSGASYVKLGEVQVTNLDDRAAEIPANHHDDVIYENAIQGRRKWRLTGTVNYLYDDEGQLMVRAAMDAGSNLTIKLMPYAEIGREKLVGTCICIQWGISGDDGAVAGSPFEFSGQGGLATGTIDANDIPA